VLSPLCFQHVIHPVPANRRARSGAGAGLYVIEAQMGAGKTEAALAAAYQLIARGHASGLYFALPTQVTSNRIHTRVSDFSGPS